VISHTPPPNRLGELIKMSSTKALQISVSSTVDNAVAAVINVDGSNVDSVVLSDTVITDLGNGGGQSRAFTPALARLDNNRVLMAYTKAVNGVYGRVLTINEDDTVDFGTEYVLEATNYRNGGAEAIKLGDQVYVVNAGNAGGLEAYLVS